VPPAVVIPQPPPLRSVSDGGAVAAVASLHSAETVVASPMLWEPEPEPEPAPEPKRSPAAAPWGLPPPSSNFEPTLVAGPPTVHEDAADPDASFYQVFQAYVLVRERCRESVEGLSYEQFRQRLQESREKIMRDHGCRGVDFQVYIKEGRAALRATPIWK
jgi:hypothetical protein